MRQIEIDIDVHRAIEAARLNFRESDNAILRRLLKIDFALGAPSLPRQRAPRSSGAYSTLFGGEPIEANSLKALLGRVLGRARDSFPGSLEQIARISRRGGRHVIAKSPTGLYPRSPHLAEFAVRLDDEWWYDGNVSRAQVASLFMDLARVLHLPAVPRIDKRQEKIPYTAEELGL